MEGSVLCRISIEWAEPVRFEVNGIDQRHAGIWTKCSLWDEVFDLFLGLITNPIVDFFPCSFVLIDEICQANACSIIRSNGIEKTLQKGIGLFSPDSIGNIELQRS